MLFSQTFCYYFRFSRFCLKVFLPEMSFYNRNHCEKNCLFFKKKTTIFVKKNNFVLEISMLRRISLVREKKQKKSEKNVFFVRLHVLGPFLCFSFLYTLFLHLFSFWTYGLRKNVNKTLRGKILRRTSPEFPHTCTHFEKLVQPDVQKKRWFCARGEGGGYWMVCWPFVNVP